MQHFLPPQSDELTAGRRCNDSELKNKNKNKKQANRWNNPHCHDFPYIIQTSSQMPTTCGEHHGLPWF